jgi:hypothetical protein
VKWA